MVEQAMRTGIGGRQQAGKRLTPTPKQAGGQRRIATAGAWRVF